MSITRAVKTVVLLLSFPVLAGCDLLPMNNLPDSRQPLRLTSVLSFNEWLTMSRQAAVLDEHQAAQQLASLDKPGTQSATFRYGLLNQQLNRIDGWILARDAFRKLADDDTLESGFRELARIYQIHNQSQINWHERHRNLQKEIVSTVLEREALQLKIDALTKLETAISERKQQPATGDAGQGSSSDTGPGDGAIE